MSTAKKMLLFAAGLVLTVVFIGIGFKTFGSANDTYKSASKQQSAQSKEFIDTDKTIYDGTTETGASVIRAISKFWEDSTTEVLVCTSDGKNLIYSKRAYEMAVGKTANGSYVLPNIVSGLPAADAVGHAFTLDSNNSAELMIAVNTAYSGGYNNATTAATAGYISDTALFLGSVQKDQNGLVRRITFIQQ